MLSISKNIPSITDADLSEELRKFIIDTQLTLLVPDTEELRKAISPFFPELAEGLTFQVEQGVSTQSTLDTLGLPVICRIGNSTFSMSPARTEEEARALLEKYKGIPYSQIRKDLGIQYHWILKVDKHTSSCGTDTLVDAHSYFMEDGQPEVYIVNLL
jgi:hypothetical protein